MNGADLIQANHLRRRKSLERLCSTAYFRKHCFAVFVAVLALVSFCSPSGLANEAKESKWTIGNIFSGKEIEAYASLDDFSQNDDAFLERLIAEGCLADGEIQDAVSLLESSVRALVKSVVSNDPRLQSARIALSESYLRDGQRQKALNLIRIVLKQQLDTDEKEEAGYRKRLSTNELLEKDVETATQFELRYQNYNSSLKVAPIAVIARQAQRMFWDNRLSDSLKMSNIGLQLSDNPSQKGKPGASDRSATGNNEAKKELVFLQSLIHFALGNRAQLSQSASALTDLVGENTQDKEDAEAHWNARLTFIKGLIAKLDGRNSDAEKLYGTAIDAVRKSSDRYDVLLFRVYLGNCQMASGSPVVAYDELNHAFEDSRRLIEGRENGLLYIGIARASLNSMYQCLLIRMSYAMESARSGLSARSRLTEPFRTRLRSRFGIDANGGFSAPNPDPLADVCRLDPVASCVPPTGAANLHPYEENYQELANALYHVGYQNKVTKNQSRARQLFWYCVYIYEKFVPENRTQLAGALYDLAESFSWSDASDIAVALFERCAQLRKRIDPYSNEYIMTLNTLGRTYGNREPKKGTDALRTALALYIRKQEIESERISRLVKQLNTNEKNDAAVQKEFDTIDIDKVPLEAQLNSAVSSRAKGDADARFQIEDLWQVIADSYTKGKNFDEAKLASQSLLKLRRDSATVSKDQLLDSIWQFAYICGVSNNFEDAKKHYSEMIEKYSKGPGKPLADWYYHRGVAEDSLGQQLEATRDFKRAISEYKNHLKTLDKIDDAETIQQIGWLVDDLQLELKAKAMCKPDSPDYYHSYPHFHWGADRFPLKIYIDDSQTRGFGPGLYALLKKAVEEWSSTPGMKSRFVFVDDREKADIYFERMSTYDLIPFGSGGGATASFINRGKKSTKEIDRVHLRLYCREHDLDKLSRHAVYQLYNLALHEFGHGLGLGHSPGGGDIMYWKSAMSNISGRDRSTLLKIYSFLEARPD